MGIPYFHVSHISIFTVLFSTHWMPSVLVFYFFPIVHLSTKTGVCIDDASETLLL